MASTTNLNYLLLHVSAVIGKQSDELLQKQLGIGLSQYRILMVLEWNPRTQQKSIAETLGQTEASISRQIKLLKAKGLLESKPDPKNKRKHLSAPTPKGMQATESASSLLTRSFKEDLSVLSGDSLRQFTESLHRLHKTVCHPGKLGACDHQLVL